jgi:hypothetical protein
MFGPREMLLTSTEPVVRQFLNAQRVGPIGMAEEKDAAEREAEVAAGVELPPLPPVPAQLQPSDGRPRRLGFDPEGRPSARRSNPWRPAPDADCSPRRSGHG